MAEGEAAEEEVEAGGDEAVVADLLVQAVYVLRAVPGGWRVSRDMSVTQHPIRTQYCAPDTMLNALTSLIVFLTTIRDEFYHGIHFAEVDEGSGRPNIGTGHI